MALRPPQQEDQGVSSLGYRLSSNRQPGIEQSNNRRPQQSNPAKRYQDYQDRGIPGNPMPMPRNPNPNFDPRDYFGGPPSMPGQRQEMPMPLPYPFDRGEQADPMPFPSPNFDPRDYENYLQEGIQPMSYVPGDDYGSYISDSVLGMDEFGGQYGPSDEYEFDYLQGLDAFPDFSPEYNRGGIASLRR